MWKQIFNKLNFNKMNKLRKGGLGHHFLEIKSLIDLMPEKESIVISYEKGDEHWKLMGKNQLPVHRVLPITDDVAYSLNFGLEEAAKALIKKYNKIYKTTYKYEELDQLLHNRSESKEKREYLEQINKQNKLIEELQKKLEESSNGKVKKEPPVIELAKMEEDAKKIKEELLEEKPMSDKLKLQLKGFAAWEKENPPLYSRDFSDTEAFEEVIRIGVDDLKPFIAWRVARYSGTPLNKGVITTEQKRMYKKATDRVVGRKKRVEKKRKNPSNYQKKTTSSGKVNLMIDEILNKFNRK